MIEILKLNNNSINGGGHFNKDIAGGNTGYYFRSPAHHDPQLLFYQCTISDSFFYDKQFVIKTEAHGCKDVQQERLLGSSVITVKNLCIGVTFKFQTVEHFKLLCRRMNTLIHKFEDYIGFEHSEIISISYQFPSGGQEVYAAIVKPNPAWFQNTLLYHTLLNTIRASMGYKKNVDIFKYKYANSFYYKYVGGSSCGYNINSRTPQSYGWSLDFIKAFKKYKELFNLESTKIEQFKNKYVTMRSISMMEFKRPTNYAGPFNNVFNLKGVEIFAEPFREIATAIYEDSKNLEDIISSQHRAPTAEEYTRVIKTLDEFFDRIMNVVHPQEPKPVTEPLTV